MAALKFIQKSDIAITEISLKRSIGEVRFQIDIGRAVGMCLQRSIRESGKQCQDPFVDKQLYVPLGNAVYSKMKLLSYQLFWSKDVVGNIPTFRPERISMLDDFSKVSDGSNRSGLSTYSCMGST